MAIEIEKSIVWDDKEIMVLATYSQPEWEEAGYDDEFGFVSQGWNLVDFHTDSFMIAKAEEKEYKEIKGTEDFPVISELFEEEYMAEIETAFANAEAEKFYEREGK
jgi:hypothetical protein